MPVNMASVASVVLISKVSTSTHYYNQIQVKKYTAEVASCGITFVFNFIKTSSVPQKLKGAITEIAWKSHELNFSEDK